MGPIRPDLPSLLLVAGAVAAGVTAVSGLLYRTLARRSNAWLLSGLTTGIVSGLVTPALALLILGQPFSHSGLVLLIGLPLGLALLGFAVGAWTQSTILRDLPVSPVAHAAHGFVKVRGTALPTSGLTHSHTGGIPCLHYSESTERYEQHTVREYDSATKTTKTRTEYRWTTIHSESGSRPFTLQDETGSLPVEEVRAEYHPVLEAHFRNGVAVGGRVLSANVGETRTTVHYIPAHAKVTVVARLRRDSLGFDPYRKCFLVIDGDDQRVYRGRGWKGIGFFVLGVALLGGSGYLALEGWHVPPIGVGGMAGDVALAMAGLALGLVIWMIRALNQLLALRQEVESAWSGIDIPLKTRADLVPNLVATVKAVARQEQELLENVVKIRGETQTPQTETRVTAETRLGAAMVPLVRRLEAYPELRSSANFLHLQRSLVEIEEEIADCRESYNQAATDYNEAQDGFPGRYVAAMVGCQPAPIFRADEAERTVPRANVGSTV
jgi:LemA protein